MFIWRHIGRGLWQQDLVKERNYLSLALLQSAVREPSSQGVELLDAAMPWPSRALLYHVCISVSKGESSMVIFSVLMNICLRLLWKNILLPGWVSVLGWACFPWCSTVVLPFRLVWHILFHHLSDSMLRLLCAGWAEDWKAPYPQLSRLFCLWNSDPFCQRTSGKVALKPATVSPV